MAEFARFKEDARDKYPTYFCYSERGLLSFLMFRHLHKTKYLMNFLNNIKFGMKNNVFKKLKDENISGIRMFSECVFGGFGSPDGIMAFKIGERKFLLFFEAKIDKSVAESNKKEKYANRIKGQLELKCRMIINYFRNPKTDKISSKKPDGFYKDDDAQTRCLRVNIANSGVKTIFDDYISKVKMEDIFYVALTFQNESPFKEGNDVFCVEEKDLNNNFGWVSIGKYMDLSHADMTESFKKFKFLEERDNW